MAVSMHPFRHSTLPQVIQGFLCLSVHVLIAFYFLNTFVANTYVIPSRSMEKSLLVGDHLLVDLVSHRESHSFMGKLLFPQKSLTHGMVVAFHPPGNPDQVYVKRIVALGGDRIAMRNRRVFLNGSPLRESYARYTGKRPAEWLAEQCVPAGHFFCLGDNRDHSNDSRYLGPIPRENIVGIPWRIFWSLQSNPGDYAAAGVSDHLHRLAAYLSRFLFRTRWRRTTRKIQLTGDHGKIREF